MASGFDESEVVGTNGGRSPVSDTATPIDRRALMRRVGTLALQTLVLTSVGASAARNALAVELDCGAFDPETGGVFPDASCAQLIQGTQPPAYTPDNDCVKPKDLSNFWPDNHCSLGPWPDSTDADCSSQATGGSGSPTSYNEDSSCNTGPPPGENDEDCGLLNGQGGTPPGTHSDGNPGV